MGMTLKNRKEKKGNYKKQTKKGVIIMEENRLNNYREQIHKIFKETNEKGYSTRYTYEDSCNRFANYLSKSEYKINNIKNISFKHLDSYVNYLKENEKSSSYIMKEISGVKFMAKHGNFKNRLPMDNKQWNLEKRNSGKIDRAWSNLEYKKMLKIAENLERYDVIISSKLALFFGLRIEETLHITPQQLINMLKNGELYITKTKHGRPRNIKITNEKQIKVAKEILEYSKMNKINVNSRILESKDGVLKEKQKIEKFIYNHQDEITDKKYRNKKIDGQKEKEQKCTMHGLRYTYCQNLEKDGYKKYLSQNTGHNREEVNRVYLNLK